MLENDQAAVQLGAGFSMQMEHGPNPDSMETGRARRERERRRGEKNDFNSAVTREMSNTGHMGFTARGLRGSRTGRSGEERPS